MRERERIEHEAIGAGAAGQEMAAGPAIQNVVTRAADDMIVAGAAVDRDPGAVYEMDRHRVQGVGRSIGDGELEVRGSVGAEIGRREFQESKLRRGQYRVGR